MTVQSSVIAVAGIQGGADALTLSGATVLAFAFMSQATAELFLQTDGTVDRRVNFGSLVQLSAGTDWIIPNGSAPGTFRGRYTNRSGPAYDFASAAEDTYRAFTVGAYEIQQIDNSPTAGGNVTTADLQIDDGSILQATGSYTLDADREDF